MAILFSILITLLLFGLGFGLYILIPFRNKTKQLIVTGVAVFIALVMIFIPSSFICSIDIPFVEMDANAIINEFLSSSNQYKTLTEMTPDFEPEVYALAQNVVKSAVVFVIEGVYLLLASLITTIIYIAKKHPNAPKVAKTVEDAKKEPAKKPNAKAKPVKVKKVRPNSGKKHVVGALFANLGCMVMSVVFLLVPLYTVSNIYINTRNAIGTGTATEVLYEKYPEFKRFSVIIDLIDKVAVIADTDTIIGEIPLYAADAFSMGAASELSHQLSSVDLLMYHFERAKITNIYKPGFDFRNTTTSTFDFTEISITAGMAIQSSMYAPIAQAYVNDILSVFEKYLVDEGVVSNPKLQMTIGEIADQYEEILDLLSFVVEEGLIQRLSSFFDKNASLSNRINVVVSAAQDLLLDTVNRHRIQKILGYELVKKLMGYFKIAPDTINLESIKHLITIGLSLYDILNKWKNSYEETPLYCAAERFLVARGLLEEGVVVPCQA